MNTSATLLREHTNRLVRLEFSDGEIVEALLLAVEPVRDHDLTYEVRRILRAGAPPARGTASGATCVASLSELVSWSAAEPC
jgi:hypothetical protein